MRQDPEKLLADFHNYLRANPGQRFWQALRNWSGYAFIYVSDSIAAKDKGMVEDTFYWGGRDG